MANISRHRTGELLRALFTILILNPDGLQAAQALRQLREAVPPTEYELGEFDSGGSRYEKIVRWATVDCVKAEWLVKRHGSWTITDEGKRALKAYPDPEQFYRRAVELYREWRKSKPGVTLPPEVVGPPDDGDGSRSITLEQAEEQAWAGIEQHLRSMPPYEVQDLVASLLRAMGYFIEWIAPPGKDGGVDILAYTDPLGTRPPRIKVQVKRQQTRVSVDGLRSFLAVLAADDVGIFVNTGGFTKDADDEARAHHSRRVTLINLERFVDLWTAHYDKLEDSARRRLPLQPVYFLATED